MVIASVIKMKLKKHIKTYWFFYLLGLIIVLGIVGIAVLNHYVGYLNNMW